MNKRFLALVALLMAALMLLGACGGDDEGGDTEAGGDEQTSPDDGGATEDATFTAIDFGFQGPETLPAGEQVEVTLENEGKEKHEMALIQLVQGKTIEDVMAFIENEGLEGPPPPWAKQTGGIPPVDPGTTGSATIDLKPGNYVAMCFAPSKKNNNKPHAALGMVYPFTVEA